MKNGNTFDNMSDLVIQRGRGVLDAIVREAKKNGIAFTRRELGEFGSKVCAQLDRNKLRKECIVQPGQIVQLQNKEIPTANIDTSGLINGIGMVRQTDENGKKSYYYTTANNISTFPKG